MRELNLVEIEQVSGAGFIQDSFASVGGVLGKALGDTGIKLVQSAADRFSPALGAGIKLIASSGIGLSGETVGHLAGFTLGGFVEGVFSGIESGFKGKFDFWK
ncbi:hypothetical protein [Pragia fontium]|uniref:Uncharacterized protein n=2 Tax=Pragia fontium TaxID=82985 RepID=A0AAJ5BH33_9GAMM|nr:hypothetical protein [Pragia fontium]AKJ42464.1 hypothetical protein QQ39_10510 [Pragia fontium]SFC76253.1 hypothetical protein SAMN02745723_10459 [Pragia fontium DSM 5563 = ATCC 49100]SUB82763.1 Uncharacterised protein [Pragia fontium]VEJ55669.1 Uncharacterised protein [Pragia fontium]GKX62726.1 hypothetical protein SOASR032_12950 [Pragia fontium]